MEPCRHFPSGALCSDSGYARVLILHFFLFEGRLSKFSNYGGFRIYVKTACKMVHRYLNNPDWLRDGGGGYPVEFMSAPSDLDSCFYDSNARDGDDVSPQKETSQVVFRRVLKERVQEALRFNSRVQRRLKNLDTSLAKMSVMERKMKVRKFEEALKIDDNVLH